MDNSKLKKGIMIKTKAFAKLNLNLHLLPKKNGSHYFPTRFINCQLELHDDLIFIKKTRDIKVICEHPELKDNTKNLVYRAAQLLKEYVPDEQGVTIYLKKNIPIKAGLGGGSADAAVTLKTLIKLWKIVLSKSKLLTIAEKLGKDVLYSLQGGVCEIKGEGEDIVPLPYFIPKLYVLIVISKEKKPSTQWMYEHIDVSKIGKKISKINKLKKALKFNNTERILANLHNDFEETAYKLFPQVAKIKEKLIKAGAKKTILAGSGLSIIGFFENKKAMIQAKRKLNNNDLKVINSYLA